VESCEPPSVFFLSITRVEPGLQLTCCSISDLLCDGTVYLYDVVTGFNFLLDMPKYEELQEELISSTE